ncbi:MAG: hypothetical protein LUE16_09650 [Lachnospiraceae bacterium]|nr:hypothetical protein [Lachnospiraceae bacterium]
MIYDEYPDRWQLYRLAESIVKTLQTESETGDEEEKISPQKWEWISDMVQVLLLEELLSRRQMKQRKKGEGGSVFIPKTENIRTLKDYGKIGADGAL